MKPKILLQLAISLAFAAVSSAFAQGTAFTYQGRLDSSGALANGSYDLRFVVYDSSAGGSQQGPILTNLATAVSNGLFTVTLDFGNQFPGANRFLEIAVRTNGNGGFTTLSPRQLLTPQPYAITAGNVVAAGLSGTYGNSLIFSNTANQFTGAFTGNGANVTNVNAASLGGLAAPNFWQTGGNNVAAGNFLGSANNQPVEIRANNLRTMQFAYASNAVSSYSPNLIGGHNLNAVSPGVVGATISGGGAFGFGPNGVGADFGTVVGGYGSVANGKYSIAGGHFSGTSGQYAVALGGSQATADYAVAMGQSLASGSNSTAFGASTATNIYATAMGKSTAGYQYCTALGGSTATDTTAFVGGATAMGFSIASSTDATAMGGSRATGESCTAMGLSTASGSFFGYATAMGDSTASGDYSTAMGETTASGDYSTASGFSCTAGGFSSMATGYFAQATNQSAFVWADSSSGYFGSTAPNQFLIRAVGGVGIGLNNPAAALHVGSGSSNPQLQITQQNPTDYTRLRMNVSGFPAWEMDVSPGSTPRLEFWTGTRLAYLDYSGNLVTAGTVNGTSDRNAKDNFTAISSRAVLDKVAAMPITEWSFKQDPSIRHIGPMAQDFYAAFQVGMDDKHIATVDEGGVALAAIQGLNQKFETENAALRAENAELKSRLEKLEKLLTRPAPSTFAPPK